MEKKFNLAKEKKIKEEPENLIRKELIGTVLKKTWLTEDDVKTMINKDCCTAKINLAIVLYHCCGINLETHVHKTSL